MLKRFWKRFLERRALKRINKMLARPRKQYQAAKDAEKALRDIPIIANKRSLMIGAVTALSMVLSTAAAKADTAFTVFGFNSGDGDTARTMPVRLNDIHNVKDFGAVGNGIADDTAKIQACINWTVAQSRGVIFFPPGTYKLTVPVTFNMTGVPSIIFTGSGHASIITGSFADFLFKRNVLAGPAAGGIYIDRLNFANADVAGGCLQVSYAISHSIRDCTFEGYRGLVLADSAGVSDQGSCVDACSFTSNGNLNGVAIIIAGNGTITNCDITGFRYGVVAFGAAANVIACRFEVNGQTTGGYSGQTAGAGIVTGVMPGCGFTAEINGTTMSVSSVSTGVLHVGDVVGAGSNQATPTTTILSQINGTPGGVGDYQVSISQTTASSLYQVFQIFSNTYIGRGLGGLTVLGTTFESNYTAISFDGGTGGALVHGCAFLQSHVGAAYGIYTAGTLQQGLFMNCAVSVDVTGAAIKVTQYNGGNRSFLTFINMTASNPGVVNPGGVAWDITDLIACSAEFIQCDIQPVWTFAKLPGSGARLQGDQFFITDANTATLGNAVTAGGAPNTAGYVVWNGTAWTLMSK